MKKLVMLSVESVFSGRVHSGMAEMVDSLANALSRDYAVTIICPDGDSVFARTASTLKVVEDGVRFCRFSAVDYYLVSLDKWLEKAVTITEQLKPDILHNFAEPEILDMLPTRPKKAICTFDQSKFVEGKEQHLVHYDCVTTSSLRYAQDVLDVGDSLAQTLSSIDFRGITAGILDVAFAPEKGLLIPSKYTADTQAGKQLCKQKLLKTYGIDGAPYICLMMCRLIKEKGLEQVFDSIQTIRDTGGVLVVVGKGKRFYEQQLCKYRRSDGVVYINRWASPVQAAPLAAGADFYLCPSNTEACGLMPMTASRYGAVPIVTLNGGLADNFNDENAIVIDSNGLPDAIRRAAALYSDSALMAAKRKVCMGQDFSWTTRKAKYIEIYEME